MPTVDEDITLTITAEEFEAFVIRMLSAENLVLKDGAKPLVNIRDCSGAPVHGLRLESITVGASRPPRRTTRGQGASS